MLQYQACTTYSFQVTKVDSIQYHSLDLYAILRRLNLHTFDYTVVTHVYISLRRWDLHHCLQYEKRIRYIYSLFLNIKGNYQKILLYQPKTSKQTQCSTMCKQMPVTNE